MDLLNSIFEKILNILLPKEKKTLEIEKLSEEEILSLEKANEIEDKKLKAFFNYKNKIVRQAIWEIKYNNNREILKKFSKILYEFILEEISDEMLFGNFKNPILIPIPSRESQKNKGFNQAELVVKEIFKNDGGKNFEIETGALFKIKETKKQSKIKNRAERLKNIVGAFSASSEKISGRNIILIDDVITTGATMTEAMRALKESGAKKVIGFSIAH